MRRDKNILFLLLASRNESLDWNPNRYCWVWLLSFPDVHTAAPNVSSLEGFALRGSLSSSSKTKEVEFLSESHRPDLSTNNLLEEPEFRPWMFSDSRSH